MDREGPLNFDEYLREAEKTAPPPNPGHSGHYSREGDCFYYFREDVAYFADRVDGLVTLLRALTDKRVIGVEIKGVRALIEGAGLLQAPNGDVEVVSLLNGTYFKQYAKRAPKPHGPPPVERYWEAMRAFGSPVRLPELPSRR